MYKRAINTLALLAIIVSVIVPIAHAGEIPTDALHGTQFWSMVVGAGLTLFAFIATRLARRVFGLQRLLALAGSVFIVASAVLLGEKLMGSASILNDVSSDTVLDQALPAAGLAGLLVTGNVRHVLAIALLG